MLRNLFMSVIFLLPLFICSAQQDEDPTQDPYAREILDRSAETIEELKSIQADFELVIEDRKEDIKTKNTGNILIKKDQYRLTSAGNTVFFNGMTMRTYDAAVNEVIITEPDPADEDFLSNPAKIFTWYNRDFKYRFRNEATISGNNFYEIDLYPMNLNQPYSRIKVFINTKTDIPEIISSIGKDGVDYTVNLTNIITNQDVADDNFIFNPSKYRKIEIIDMRGVK